MLKWFLVIWFGLFQTAAADPIQIWSHPVTFAPFENDHVKLISVNRLSSLDDHFGGLSGLAKVKDGFIAVTDRGNLLHINARRDRADVYPLKSTGGAPLSGKKKTDAESIALFTGQLAVSFERKHRVKLFDFEGHAIDKKIKLPSEISDLPNNGGLEAIERLQDGRYVLIAEGKGKAAESSVWLQTGKKKWRQIPFKLFDDFRPTGLARLPDSDDLILVERFYEALKGVRARLTLLDPVTFERKALLAHLAPPTPLDNFEGITVYKNDQGQTMIALVSDDNFSILQRTLLMTLELKTQS